MYKLRYYMYRYKGLMIGGFGVKLLGVLSELIIPLLLGYLIDTVTPKKDIWLVCLYGFLMLLAAFSAFLFNMIANRITAKAACYITRDLRHDLFKKITYLSCQQIDKFTMPSVISRLTTNTYDINQMLCFVQRIGVRAPILIIGGIITTAIFIDHTLSLILVAAVPLIILAVIVIQKTGTPLFVDSYKKGDHLVRNLRENITGIKVVKAFSKEETEKNRFSYTNAILSKSEQRANNVMALSNPIMSLIFRLGFVAILIVGAYRVHHGFSEKGGIIAFIVFYQTILNALVALTRVFVIYSKATVANKRIFEVLNTSVALNIEEFDYVNTSDHIRFENVSFSYLKQQNAINNISFSLLKGQTLGIIGDVGSGKTTIINLLMRLYDPDSGTIRINGHNIKSINFDELYTMFGVAFQNDILFADTIYNNIAFYNDSTEENVQEAARFAQAFQFVNDYTNSFEHIIAKKGNDLSGGQKQRLLISRALARGAAILILDDSSSALDFKTDALLRHNLNNYFKDVTKIIVGQRISSIKHADLILVIDDGEIIAKGNHEELLINSTYYRDIYQIQMGGIKDE